MRYLLAYLLLLSWCNLSGQSKPLDSLLLRTFQQEGAANDLFEKAYEGLKTRADTANYLYFKLYKVYALDDADSTIYYSKKVIPLLQDLDSLERLRKVQVNTHYAYLQKGNYEMALQHIHGALDMAEKLRDTAYISLHHSDKSIIYHDFEDFEKGVLYGKKAYNIMDGATNKQYKYLIIANNAIGINFDDWKKPDSALYYHYKNLDLLKKVEDTLYYGFVYNNIGNTLLKAKKYKEAKKIILRALAINKVRNRDYNLATNYTNLATIAYEESNYDDARTYFVLANQFANASGSIEKIRDVAQQEAWFYKKIKDFEKALERQEYFYKLRDSVFNKERAAALLEVETKYDTEKKENEILQQRAQLAEKDLEVRRKNTLIYGGFGLALVLALLGYLLYNQQKLRNRQLIKETELQSALAQIETQNKLQEQRLRISRDLHDNIGSQLTFVTSSVDNLQYALKKGDSNIIKKLGNISAFTTQTIYELRDTIWAMNKTEITAEDLQVRIANFLENARKASDAVTFTFEIDPFISELTFTSVEGMNIYRIIQEAVNNALKYAQASNIAVLMKRRITDGQPLCIQITDNGIGFEHHTVETGNGFVNIRKRARELGGKAEITSSNEGTQILVVFNK